MTALIVGSYIAAFLTLTAMYARCLTHLHRAIRRQKTLRAELDQRTNFIDLLCDLQVARGRDEAFATVARYEIRQAGDIDAEYDRLLRDEGDAS